MKKLETTSATPAAVSEQDRLGSIALDQWRGLALLLVLLSHGFYFTDRVAGVGRVGVNLFFFISGILVFRSLSRTRSKTNLERTKSFWWRRLRRLYPATFAYSLAMLPVAWLLQSLPSLPPASDFPSYLKTLPSVWFYVVNYTGAPRSLGHLWSLACEMQFYLLAPIIFALGGVVIIRRNILFGTLLVVLMVLGMMQPFFDWGRYHFEFAVWPMMLGFCCEYKRDWFSKLPRRIVTVILWSSIGVCGPALLVTFFAFGMKSVVVAAGALLLLPCLLAYLYGRPMPGSFGYGMKWLGERTYSIYLWQQPFTICDFLPNILHPLGAIIAVGVGGLWFRLFEWPFLTASRREIERNELQPRKHSAGKFFSVAVVVLLIGICIAFIAARHRYEKRLSNQIWTSIAPSISPAINGSTNAQSTVLFLGDSRLAQWNVHLSGVRIVNGAAGGLTSQQVCLAAPELLDRYHPDVVVLEAGINDLKYIGLRPELSGVIVSNAFCNLTAIVTQCTDRHSKVLLLETWPAGDPSPLRRLVWDHKISLSLNELNSQLRKLNLRTNGVYVANLFKDAGLDKRTDLYRDTMHLKSEFYEQLTPVLAKELGQVFLSK